MTDDRTPSNTELRLIVMGCDQCEDPEMHDFYVNGGRPYIVMGTDLGYEEHTTLDEALADAESRIDDCLDDTWSEEVDEILVARVTHRAVRNVMGRRADMTPEAWTELTGGRTDVDEWWIYSIEPVDPTDQAEDGAHGTGRSTGKAPAVTDDPSTNSERRWVCAYPESEPCEPEDWNDEQDATAIGCGYYPATPSPVLDSERPASDLIERLTEMVRLIDWRGSEARLRNLLTEAVIALEAADAHRCPTPEGDVLAELRAAWETTQGAGRTVLILDAVDRLLASHPGGGR